MRDRGTTFRSGACGTRADLRPRPGDPDGVCLLLSSFLLVNLFATAGHAYCRRPLAGRPARQSARGPREPSGPATPLPCHNCFGPACAAVRPLSRLLDLLATGKTLTPESLHVYSRHDRFPVRGEGRVLRPRHWYSCTEKHASGCEGRRGGHAGWHGKAAQPRTGGCTRMNRMKIVSTANPAPTVVRGTSPDSIHRAREAARAFTDSLSPAPDPAMADTLHPRPRPRPRPRQNRPRPTPPDADCPAAPRRRHGRGRGRTRGGLSPSRYRDGRRQHTGQKREPRSRPH